MHSATGDKAQAEEDAKEAAIEGEFSFITSSGESDDAPQPLGVICFTPHGRSPASIMVIGTGHVDPPEVVRKLTYGAAYNRAMVDRPDYPFRDLCRARAKNEHTPTDDPARVATPARIVTGPPRDLFEAARRGTRRDVRQWITRETLNAFDGVGMTALAWAVARNNQAAVDALISAGANPWQSGDGYYIPQTAVYWAAALGRRATFLRLQRRRGQEFEEGWPSSYLAAAMNANDPVIFRIMLAQPHERIRFEFLRRPLPETQMFAMAVEKQRNLATPLLFKALGYDTDRPDLVRMALAHGADPNALDAHEAPLSKVSRGHYESSVEIVDMLLKAGADPNIHSIYGRPVWRAFDMMRQEEHFPDFARRSKVIFDKLIAAGADLNLPARRGLPPIWDLLFPYSWNRDKLDPYRATPEDFEMLASHGLDVNAEWNGKRVLGLVEAQAGRDSELATTLRRLGARP